ncbi:hypothetical protein EAF00_007013 [Botryotinia globosa]|nr:hypothetical protein EAF00_007013 [Botryotinia globosa]
MPVVLAMDNGSETRWVQLPQDVTLKPTTCNLKSLYWVAAGKEMDVATCSAYAYPHPGPREMTRKGKGKIYQAWKVPAIL